MSPNPTLTQDALAALRVEAERRAKEGEPLPVSFDIEPDAREDCEYRIKLPVLGTLRGPYVWQAWRGRSACVIGATDDPSHFSCLAAAQWFVVLLLARAAAPLRALMDAEPMVPRRVALRACEIAGALASGRDTAMEMGGSYESGTANAIYNHAEGLMSVLPDPKIAGYALDAALAAAEGEARG
jgi:hypothetical protein